MNRCRGSKQIFCRGRSKDLQKAQDALEAAEASALAQASEVDEMPRTVALFAETARKTRLMLERMVKARKEQIRTDAIGKAKVAFAVYATALEDEISPIHLVCQQPDFIAAAKNKKTPIQSPRCPKYRACERQDRRGFGSEGHSRKVGLVQRKRQGLRGLVR
jgi:hypothetical protein